MKMSLFFYLNYFPFFLSLSICSIVTSLENAIAILTVDRWQVESLLKAKTLSVTLTVS